MILFSLERSDASGTQRDFQMEESWRKIVIPGHLRNQFLEQFGTRLAGHLPPSEDRFKDVTIGEVLNAFDVADKHIGKHWPLLATDLWSYGAHILLSAYIETSGTIGSALRGMLSTSTMLYPVFSPVSEIVSDGLLMKGRPTFDMEPRHWEIFQIFSLLSQTAVYKRFAPEETKEVVCHLTIEENELSNTIRKIASCEVHFNCSREASYYLYPHKLLSKKITHKHKDLNSLLFSEIQRQTQLPSLEDNLISELNKIVFKALPSKLSSEAASEKLGISRSTLHRALRRHDLSYSDILKQNRREFVLIYFSNPSVRSNHHVPLGFSSHRALSDFCKVNFGKVISELHYADAV